MDHSHLHLIPEGIRLRHEGSHDACSCGTDVWPQGQRVHALQFDEAYTYERSQGRGEDGAGLDDDGGASTEQDGEVACQPGHFGDVRVDHLQ